MAKKINVELDIDVDVKGLGCKSKNQGFENGKPSKEVKELSKVFSGEDFKL
jgi:hypothetical protein